MIKVTDDFKIMTNRAIVSIKDEDKESFKNSIDGLKEDVTILKQKHSYDIKILEKEYHDLKNENEKE